MDADSLPPGSNHACSIDNANTPHPRIRVEWDDLTPHHGKALYLDAVETAIERNLHQTFARYHSDRTSNLQAHETCAFFLWHRRYTLAYENMLRSLEPRFACLTVPYWDVTLHHARQSGKDGDGNDDPKEECDSYSTCGLIVNDLGGVPANNDFFERWNVTDGENIGLLHDGSPVQNLRDERNRGGVIRYDLHFDPLPVSTGAEVIYKLFFDSGGEGEVDDIVSFWTRLRKGVHNDVHDTIGGNMRTPYSPVDPLFFPWHTFVDLVGHLWHVCKVPAGNQSTSTVNAASSDHSFRNSSASPSMTMNCTVETTTNRLAQLQAAKLFPAPLTFQSEIHLRKDGFDVRDDVLIGEYFDDAVGMTLGNVATLAGLDAHNGYAYGGSLPQELMRLLLEDEGACPYGRERFVLDGEHGMISLPYRPRSSQQQEDEERTTDIAAMQEETAQQAAHTKSWPSFTPEEIEDIHTQWINDAQNYFDKQYPTSTPDARHTQMEYVHCQLNMADADTLERWAIDNHNGTMQEDGTGEGMVLRGGAFFNQVVLRKYGAYEYDCRNHNSGGVDHDIVDSPASAPGLLPTTAEPSASASSAVGVSFGNHHCWVVVSMLAIGIHLLWKTIHTTHS